MRRAMKRSVRIVLWMLLGAAACSAAPVLSKAPAVARDEQKHQAELDQTLNALDEARKRGDKDAWTRALVRSTDLRLALHGYETAVQHLRETPWPDDLKSQTVLRLFYAQTLRVYLGAYGWEIRQRERTDSIQAQDLKAWTVEQIFSEALGSFEKAWKTRQSLGTRGLELFAPHLQANDYPRRIRGTARDVLTYLMAELLADSSLWTPEQSHGVFRLNLEALLQALGNTHPLERLASILTDLERWHAAAGRKEAALEARLTLIRYLHAHFTQEEDRKTLRTSLEKELQSKTALEWWSEGMATLSELTRESGDLAKAHSQAAQGAKGQGVGAKRSVSIRAAIESPAFTVRAMNADGPDRKSLEVTHRNVATLDFAAYRLELDRVISDAKDYSLFPSPSEINALTNGKTPVARWTVNLPATPDFKDLQTAVTSTLKERGLYLVTASGPDGALAAAPLFITDLMLVLEQGAGGELTVVHGDTGRPLAGVTVQLYRYDWQKGHQRIAEKTSQADGRVKLPVEPRGGYFAVARKGTDSVLLQHLNPIFASSEQVGGEGALIYTDRSAYRPGQKVRWKVIAFRRTAASRYKTSPKSRVSVELYDANGEQVEKREMTTNGFGSAAGEWVIPSGRALGMWTVRTSPGHAVSAFAVEEYKRPTFEATWTDPAVPWRLNRQAALKLRASYLFGQPVSSGAVQWTVKREPLFPWWWWGRWGGIPGSQQTQTIAAGSGRLDAQGEMDVSFVPEADERLKDPEHSLTYRYVLQADVTDEAGETRSTSRSVRLGFVSVESELRLAEGFLNPDTVSRLSVKRRTLDGQPAPGTGTWRLLELKQPEQVVLPADVPGPQGPSRFQTQPAPFASSAVARWDDGAERARGTLTHDATGEAFAALPKLKPGAYRIRYETRDSFGETAKSQMELIVAGGRDTLKLPLMLAVQQAETRVGGKIRLFASTALPGRVMWLDVYRAGRRLERRVLPPEASTVTELPVREEDRGGLSFTLSTVRDYQLIVASRQVSVPWDDRRLDVTYETFRDSVKPGSKQTLRIRVKSSSGKPMNPANAETVAYMFDQALESIHPHAPPSVAELYPDRAHGLIPSSNVAADWMQWVRPPQTNVSWPQAFRPDSWNLTSGYGVGGLGRRGRSLGGMADAQLNAVAKSAASVQEQAQSSPPKPPLRTHFSETAFWKPTVTLDSNGMATVEFQVPDSVTAWQVWTHVVTKDLEGGSVHRISRSVKELMVRPYLPRFLREGDAATFKVAVNNTASQPMSGELQVDLVDPVTGKDLSADFKVSGARQKFEVAGGKTTTLAVSVETPRRLGEVLIRARASSGAFSDGEQRALPVLPGRMHLMESRFAALQGHQKRELKFEALANEKDPTRLNQQLVLTVDAQLFQTVLASLPSLVESPHESTETFVNSFLATAILGQVFEKYPSVARLASSLSTRSTPLEAWKAEDPNRAMALEETPWLREARGGEPDSALLKVLDPRIAAEVRKNSLEKLQKAQTQLGGFPWFPGGPPSPHMTLYVLYQLSKASELGAPIPRELVQKAWAYVAKHYRDEYARSATRDECCWEWVTFMNYVASNFPDASYLGDAFSAAERTTALSFSFKHWKEHSPYLKAYLALTLKRMGRSKDAHLVFDSIMDSAKTTPEEGTFWAPEDRAWLWYNDRIETHALALRALLELRPDDSRQTGLVQWLMLNKKLNQWKSTRATAEVVYSLLKAMGSARAVEQKEEVQVKAGGLEHSWVFEPGSYTGKSQQWVIPGPALKPDASTVQIDRRSSGLMFASATWHYSTEQLPSSAAGDFFQVNRAYFKRDVRGTQTVWGPWGEGSKLEPGDVLEVRLSIRAKHAAEYVLLRDPRPAGFEPEQVRSGHRWDLGLVRYEEIRDSGTHFFFENLPAGEYTLKYRLRAATGGRFKAAPAQLQSLYAPEFTARTAGSTLSITP